MIYTLLSKTESFLFSLDWATAGTYTTGPHVASIGQRFFFVELKHGQKLGVVGVGLPALIGKTSYCSHG